MDSLVLYGPGGASPVNLGSWLRADIGVDFGARGLIHAIESESFADGGAYAYERAGIRKMSVPLVLASGGAGLGLTSLESLLRLNARPGGYLDVQVEGAASAEAVRFDLVHGRWEPEYSVYHQRVSRRVGALMLDTQPFGYWPTWITLASAASMMSPGRLPIKAASIIGDAPAYARIVLTPDEQGAMASTAVGTQYRADFLAWSIGGGGSIPTFLPGASWTAAPSTSAAAPTYFSDPTASMIAGGPTGIRFLFGISGADKFFKLAQVPIDNRSEGRHRVFAWSRMWGPSAVGQFDSRISVDVVGASYDGPLASAAMVASIGNVASMTQLTGGSIANASGIGYPYWLLDLGEVSVPNVPGHKDAYPSYTMQMRFWGYVPNTSPAASYMLDLLGVFLLPADGPGGYVPRHLEQPSVSYSGGSVVEHGVALDSYARSVTFRNVAAASAGIFDAVEGFSGRQFYIGGLPYLGASDTNLNVVFEDRRINSGGGATRLPVVRAYQTATKASVSYRPRFTFLKGL